MHRDFGEDTAIKIMNTKLQGKPRDAVYKLTDAELAILKNTFTAWTVCLSQILANRIGADQTKRMIQQVVVLPENQRVAMAQSAGKALDNEEVPDEADFAAYILCNHTDQLLIESEIQRRETLN